MFCAAPENSGSQNGLKNSFSSMFASQNCSQSMGVWMSNDALFRVDHRLNKDRLMWNDAQN
jgi:hypothetical protein